MSEQERSEAEEQAPPPMKDLELTEEEAEEVKGGGFSIGGARPDPDIIING
jgi:hypothetical protein